jgi:OOP family OmpA-OmpF porin
MPVYASAPIMARALVSASKVTLATDVLFDFGKATLRPEAKAKLDDLAAKAAGVKLEVILAVGHSDRLEGENPKRKLSEERAAAVKAYLVSKGVPEGRVYVEGKGSKQPVTGEKCKGPKNAKTIACLQPDRRVDIELIGMQ